MRRNCPGGFTLIELLVAVLLLAIGIIGAAGTQLFALRTRHGSALLSDGVQLASNLAERMRANADHMDSGDAANLYLQLHYDASSGPPPVPAALCYGPTGCDSAQLARFDLYEIARAVHQHFPGGRVAVCRDARPWHDADQSLGWDCLAAADAPVVIKLGWQARRGRGAPAPPVQAPGAAAPAVVIVVGGSAA